MQTREALTFDNVDLVRSPSALMMSGAENL